MIVCKSPESVGATHFGRTGMSGVEEVAMYGMFDRDVPQTKTNCFIKKKGDYKTI